MLKANNGSSCYSENELQAGPLGDQPGTDQAKSDGALNLGHCCEDGGRWSDPKAPWSSPLRKLEKNTRVGEKSITDEVTCGMLTESVEGLGRERSHCRNEHQVGWG